MTRIDFHTNIPDKLSYACRLARKAYAAGGKLVLLTEDAAQAAKLNDALWSLSETDFLPHVMAGDPLAAQTPIIVTDSDEVELPHGDMLVNLARRAPANVDRFSAYSKSSPPMKTMQPRAASATSPTSSNPIP